MAQVPMVTAISCGDSDGVSGCWPQPGPDPENQWVGDLHLCFSGKLKKNK